MTDAITGINAMECMIEYALSGTVSTDVRSLIDPHFNGEYGWVVDFIARPGIISEIRGLDEISRMKNVVGVAYNHSPGDKIRDDQKGQLSQIVLRVIGKSGRLSEINSDMQEVYRKLSVRSDTDTEMLLPFDDIRQYYGIIEKSRGGY